MSLAFRARTVTQPVGRTAGTPLAQAKPRTLPRRDALLVDYGGTLDGDGDRWAVRFYRAYRAAGGRMAFEPFEDQFKESDRRLAKLPDVERLGVYDTFERQARLLLELLSDGREFEARTLADPVTTETLEAADRNRALLERLSEHYRVAVVANFTGNLERCLAELGMTPYVTSMLDSARVGCTKPDERIFHMALKALDRTADAAWMIGDNFEADIRPAARLGMLTCWVAPADRAWPAGTEGIATARVSRFADLAEVLK